MRPLIAATLAFAAGTLAGLRFELGPDVILGGTALSCALGGVLLHRRGKVDAVAERRAVIVLLGFAAIGLLSASGEAWRIRTDCRTQWPDGARLSLNGSLDGAPTSEGSAWLRVESVQVRGRDVPCHGTVRVTLPARGGTLPSAGVRLAVSGQWWTFPREGDWPAPPEWRGTLSVRSFRLAEDGRIAHPMLHARGAAQQRVRALFPEKSGLAEALVLAQRGGIEADVKQDFAASGLTHLLSISGTHVALVAGALLLLAGVVRLPFVLANVVAAAGTVAYVLFLGAPHPAARSALQILLLLAARLAQRPSDPYTLLAFAGLVLLVADPMAALDAGFQLSFAGIFGLLALRRPLRDRLPARLPRWLRDGIASGTAATLATTPIVAFHFGLASWIGILANLAAIPLVGLAVPAVALAMVVHAIHARAGAFLANGGTVLLDWLERSASSAAAVPFGHAYVSRAAVMTWLTAAAAYFVAVGWWRSRPRAHAQAATRQTVLRKTVGAATATAVLIGAPAVAPPGGNGTLEIHAIDVGQGDAFAIRSPEGRWILVDAGPFMDGFDAGRARVLPFLLRHGVDRVDALILTHPHADHIGGTAALLGEVEIGAILDPAIPSEQQLYSETLSRAAVEGARWFAARDGREIRLGDVLIRFLAPSDSVALDAPDDPNDFSVVFRLSYGRSAAVFMGDAPASVENDLVERHGPRLAANVLKVGHHGSRTSTGDSLLAAVRPRLALVSVGRWNRYGHPDPSVLARLAEHDVRVLRTDERGTVSVRLSAGGETTVTGPR